MCTKVSSEETGCQMSSKSLFAWVIDFNGKSTPSRVIQSLDVRESRWLYFDVYIFCVVFLKKLFWFNRIRIFSSSSVWTIDWILTNTSTPTQSKPRSNCNKSSIQPHSLELQDWTLIIRCSLMSYPGYVFCEEGLNPLQGMYLEYSRQGWYDLVLLVTWSRDLWLKWIPHQS